MGQVVDCRELFFQKKCPVGSLAMHDIHGMCEVKRAEKFQRVIEVVIPDGTSYYVINVIVDVKTLKIVDPLKEL